jgi:hypothetical protein
MRNEFLLEQTKRLEALGMVLGSKPDVQRPGPGPRPGPIHPHPRRGRKRIHASGYARLKAYRRRKSGIRIKVTDDNEIGL